jgi:hypothetical protein
MLTPDKDTESQLGSLSAAFAQAPALLASLPDASDWLSAWSAVMSQAIAEGEDGALVGMDSAREQYLSLADQLTEVGALTWLRTLRASNMGDRLTLHPIWVTHRSAWQAIRALRQNLYWIASANDLTARLPVLAISADGAAMINRLSVDPLESDLSRDAASATLNALAKTLTWRA